MRKQSCNDYEFSVIIVRQNTGYSLDVTPKLRQQRRTLKLEVIEERWRWGTASDESEPKRMKTRPARVAVSAAVTDRDSRIRTIPYLS